MRQAGKFKYIKGLVVGKLTDIEKDKPSFGKSPEEIVLEAVKEYDFPVCFNFPAGHGGRNLALIFGATVQLDVTDKNTTLNFI